MKHVIRTMFLPVIFMLMWALLAFVNSSCQALRTEPVMVFGALAGCAPGIGAAVLGVMKTESENQWAAVTAGILTAAGDIVGCVEAVRALNDDAVKRGAPSAPPARLAALPAVTQAVLTTKAVALAVVPLPLPSHRELDDMERMLCAVDGGTK